MNNVNDKDQLAKYIEAIKEKPILKRFPKTAHGKRNRTDPEKILYCVPEEVVLRDIEKNKTYEIPVRIYNATNTSKRFSIKPPGTPFFKYKYDFDNKNKNCQIAPGLYIEILIIFEAQIANDHHDSISIESENGFKLPLELKAFIAKPEINFEPFINLGFVPLHSRKEETIEFANEGHVEAAIELKHDRNTEIVLDNYSFQIGRMLRDGEKDDNKEKKSNRKEIKLSYE